MRRKLIVGLFGFGGAFALALALAAPASSADTKVDAFGCRLIIVDGHYKTICAQQ
jgi:NhaP-type Na+/H+ or K+/H+ antiporter